PDPPSGPPALADSAPPDNSPSVSDTPSKTASPKTNKPPASLPPSTRWRARHTIAPAALVSHPAESSWPFHTIMYSQEATQPQISQIANRKLKLLTPPASPP